MSKIDNSTYKSIQKSRKNEKKSRNEGKYAKGKYGHSKAYKNLKIIMTLSLFLIILLDVVFSLIIFQTRKTLFVIIGCIMAIPFARNLIDLFMSLKADPLSKEEYEKVNDLSENVTGQMLYDITITDTDGVVYIPSAHVYNNVITAYVPKAADNKEKTRIKKYISVIQTEETKYVIEVTNSFKTYESMLKKRSANSYDENETEENVYKLLSMGF